MSAFTPEQEVRVREIWREEREREAAEMERIVALFRQSDAAKKSPAPPQPEGQADG